MGAVELAFETWGDRNLPGVLLLHGIGGSGRLWRPVAERLAGEYHLIAPDLRGHGTSPRATDYAAEQYLIDVEAFIERRQLRGVALVGHALSGLLCVQLAQRRPENVRALVSIDVNVPASTSMIDRLRAAGTDLRPGCDSRSAHVECLLAHYAPAADRTLGDLLADALLIQRNGGMTLNFDLEVLRQATAPPVDSLAGVSCPTLLLRGSESTVMDRANGIALLRQLEHARLVQIPRAGHHVFLDNPAATVRELRAFLGETLPRQTHGGPA
jgi:pimeloyl-ACP methyl ester carboxylesterase